MTWKPRVALVGVGLAACATLFLGKGGHIHASTAQADRPTISVPAPEVFGMHLTAIPVPGNRHPVLPNGSSGITRDEAVDVALGFTTGAQNHKLRPNVDVLARYGIFSDDERSQRSATGDIQALYQNRPVWLVTFYGPGVVEAPMGSYAPGTPNPLKYHHEDNVVVDAATGQMLEAYT
jgi:hypothetical protein